MSPREVITFWLDMGASISLLSRIDASVREEGRMPVKSGSGDRAPPLSRPLGAAGHRNPALGACGARRAMPTLAAPGTNVRAGTRTLGDQHVRRTRRRSIAIFIGLAVLLSFAAAPASALTLQRTWTARLGTSGVNGAVSIKAYTSGAGVIGYNLKGLRANSTYSVQIRKGTCSSLGTLTARLSSVRTSSTGTVVRGVSLTSGTMIWIWSAARTPSFVIRVVSGTSIRCGNFSFAKATRVAVSGLGIDLPVIRGPSGYPPCRVAMYHAGVSQPREPGVTFIYAHARTGMFLPLLTRWRIDRGASLIGRTVRVWTSDSYVITYRISRVRVASNAMSGVTSLASERLWLQTSTGPNSTYPKLIVEATRISAARTTYAASHPTARPVRC